MTTSLARKRYQEDLKYLRDLRRVFGDDPEILACSVNDLRRVRTILELAIIDVQQRMEEEEMQPTNQP